MYDDDCEVQSHEFGVQSKRNRPNGIISIRV